VDVVTESVLILADTALDVLPVAAFLLLFQLLVIRKRPSHDTLHILSGFGFVVLGLGLFLIGLEESLFPIGRLMAAQLTHPELLGIVGDLGKAHWSDYYWVYLFAFAIGFSTTVAEPALLAVAMQANEVSGGAVSVWGLRVAVAIGVAVGVTLGCYRIVVGLPVHYFIIGGYILVMLQTAVSPRLIVPLAYDSGGVTTSTVTVPLITALGLGLAEAVPGRSALIDGFGLVAFASLFPIMAVLAYAQLSAMVAQRPRRATPPGRSSPDE